jgi:hypothetical protein
LSKITGSDYNSVNLEDDNSLRLNSFSSLDVVPFDEEDGTLLKEGTR